MAFAYYKFITKKPGNLEGNIQMNAQLMHSSLLSTTDCSLIALSETPDSYLMKVDLPSLPNGFVSGPICAGKNDVVIESDTSPLVSIHTQSGKMRTAYYQGALYILLPKFVQQRSLL